jgi:hypothetical protein
MDPSAVATSAGPAVKAAIEALDEDNLCSPVAHFDQCRHLSFPANTEQSEYQPRKQ